MEYQNSSGCRECANSHHVLFVPRPRPRWPGRSTAAARTRTDASRSSLGDGSCVRRPGTRQLVLELNMIPVVPPKSNRRDPWDYDRELYKKRNEVERLFRRLKGFRRIFSRFEKLDVVFLAFIYFAFIVEALR